MSDGQRFWLVPTGANTANNRLFITVTTDATSLATGVTVSTFGSLAAATSASVTTTAAAATGQPTTGQPSTGPAIGPVVITTGGGATTNNPTVTSGAVTGGSSTTAATVRKH